MHMIDDNIVKLAYRIPCIMNMCKELINKRYEQNKNLEINGQLSRTNSIKKVEL